MIASLTAVLFAPTGLLFNKLGSDIKGLNTKLDSDIKGLNTDIKGLNTKLDTDIKGLNSMVGGQALGILCVGVLSAATLYATLQLYVTLPR